MATIYILEDIYTGTRSTACFTSPEAAEQFKESDDFYEDWVVLPITADNRTVAELIQIHKETVMNEFSGLDLEDL